MLTNIDINKMNHLMEENEDARQIITQLLENHQSAVSTIAHEIRNPLTLISSSLQIMQKQHPEVTEFFNWHQTMEDIDFMCSLLNELSTFNNGNTLHPSVFNIEKLLRNVAISFAISLDSEESDINFASRIHPDMGNFTGDKNKLEQVLLNLLKNAKEAVSSSENASIFFSAERINDQILIQCQDNGIGIPDEVIQTIFDPFVTYKENGTGLGLAISRRIAEAHGGTLTARSDAVNGTVFSLTLPV